MKKREGIFYGWWVVLACSVNHIYASGTFFYGFTAIFNPIVEEFGWSYALVGLAFSLRGFEAGFLAPIIGIFVDKVGPRKLLFCGYLIMGLGFLLFGHIHSLLSFYVIFGILGLGLGFASNVVTMAAVSRWFRKRTSLAMGLVTAGNGAGGLLVPGVVWLVDQVGWRGTVSIFGIGALLLGIPLSLVVKDPWAKANLLKKESPSATMDKELRGLTTKEVIRTSDFWLLSAAVFFAGVAVMAVTVHQIPFLVSIGVSRRAAGFAASAFAFSSVIGRLGFGWIGDTVDKKRCFAIAAFIMGSGLFALSVRGNMTQIVLGLIGLGIGSGGTVPLRSVLQVESFGPKAFGSVQGLLTVLVTVGAMISPPLVGWAFDLVGSYQPAFLALAAVTLMAVPAVLAMSGRSRTKTEVGSGQ